MPMQPAKPLVFIVDDVPENIQIALSHLRELDCDFAYATSGEQAIERITASRPQLVLMDVMMPGISGFQTAERLKRNPVTRSIPVIFLTAKADSEDVARGFSLGGVDYVVKPFKGVELRARVRNRAGTLRLPRQHGTAGGGADHRGRAAQGRDHRGHGRDGRVPRRRPAATSTAPANTCSCSPKLASRGHFTATLTPDYIILLHKSAPLHDIGKVAIRDSILLKPGKLTAEEFEEMKAHTLFGEEAIAALEQMAGHPTSFLSCAKEIAGSHHEKFDGSGYPRGGRRGHPCSPAGSWPWPTCTTRSSPNGCTRRPCATGHAGHGRGPGRPLRPARVLDAFLVVEPQFQGIASRYID